MTQIEFVDELPPTTGGDSNDTRLKRLVEACKANPGKWTLLAAGPRSDAPRIRQRGTYMRKRYGLEQTSRMVDGECHLYVRYQNGATA